MFRLKRLSIILVVFVLFAQVMPQTFEAGAAQVENENEEKVAVLLAEKPEGKITLFSGEDSDQMLTLIPDGAEVEVLESADERSLVRYMEIPEGQSGEIEWIGYVENLHVVAPEEAEELKKKRLDPDFDLREYQRAKNEEMEDSQETKRPEAKEEENIKTDEENKEPKEEKPVAPHMENKSRDEPSTKGLNKEGSNRSTVKKENITIKGIAMKNPTNIYAAKSRESKVLKTYQQGHILAFQPLDSNWHSALVNVNGETLQGYIHKGDVDLIVEPKKMTGVALKQPAMVYETPSESSRIIGSYPYNQEVAYQTLSSRWHTVVIHVNGTAKTGYVRAADIGPAASSPAVRGIALLEKTPVFSAPKTDSNILKEYKKGSILKYRAYQSGWFIATVYVNGKTNEGYINAKHVETAVSDPKGYKGVAIKNPVQIYAMPSASSKTVKSYKYGSILQFRTFARDWHEVTVYVKGKKQAGYLKAADIGDLDTTLKGYAVNKTTSVYKKPAQGSGVFKSYKRGHLLQFRAYSANWFSATVLVNGKKQTGYIQTKDISPDPPVLKGFAYADPTPVYSSTSKNSTKLKTYKKGQALQYRPYNADWYAATVYINGKATTGYIYKKDTGEQPPLLSGFAKYDTIYVYSQTSKASAKLKSYRKGQPLKYRYHNSNWYKAVVYVKGKARAGFIHKNDVGPATDISFVNPFKIYSYQHMVADIKNLQKAYPDLISYKVIGKSEYGRNIYAVSLGKGKATTIINGSHHAREWLTTNLNMYMIEQYAKAYRKNVKIKGYDAKSILNGTTIWFIPMVNPDGVILQQQGLKAYPKSMHASLIKMNNGSKDFKRWKANIKGVDLNRQYDAGWKTIAGNVDRPNYKNHKGNAPATAAEVKAVLKLDAEIDPEIAVAYHTSGQILYWYYKQTGSAYERDHHYAKTIGKLTGYRLVKPVPNPSGGGYTDWFIEKRKRPGFTPEIAPYVFETNPPVSVFSQVWRENQGVGLFVAAESAKLYKARKK
jgi:hypothetical protein